MASILWAVWYFFFLVYRCSVVKYFGPGKSVRRIVLSSWVVALGLLYFVLRYFSSFDVRDSNYLYFYMVVGAAWVALALSALRWLDWHFHEDVLERNNRAAALAHGGAIVGLMLAFAGANIGDGPSWMVVIFCALLSTAALMAFWLIVDLSTGWGRHVTVDRDPASGLRAGAFFVAGGLIAGRAVAGDWVSVPATMQDYFSEIWGLVPLALLAGVNQLLLRPSERHPHGSLPAAALGSFVLIGCAVVFCYYMGPME